MRKNQKSDATISRTINEMILMLGASHKERGDELGYRTYWTNMPKEGELLELLNAILVRLGKNNTPAILKMFLGNLSKEKADILKDILGEGPFSDMAEIIRMYKTLDNHLKKRNLQVVK